MLSTFLIAVAFVTESAAPAPAPAVSVSEIIAAQSASAAPEASLLKLTTSTNAAAKRVTLATRSRQSLESQRVTLRRQYNTQLAAISKLSRQRASWNRDRKIRNQKSAAQALARKLAALDRKLRLASTQISTSRRQLLRAVERELGARPMDARQSELRRLRVALSRALRPRARKIVLPDETIDRFADPDELDKQVQHLRRVERQLVAEDKKLAERYRYYSRQEKLRAQSERATEVARADGESIRRSPGLGTARTGANDAAGGAPDAETDFEDGGDGGNGPSTASDTTLESSSIVLADVVDQVTAADLRRAGRSANPATKARAAGRARKQLKARIERLRRQRAAVAQRAKKLRSR